MSVHPEHIGAFRRVEDHAPVCMCIAVGQAVSAEKAAELVVEADFAEGREDVLALLVSVANDDNPFKAKTVKVRAKKVAVVEGAVKLGRGALGKVYPEIKMTPRQAEQIRNEFNAKHKDLV